MYDLSKNEFVDLSKFVETQYVNHIYSEISDKDTNKKYLMIKSVYSFESYSKNRIIAFSQEVNTNLQLIHPSILKFIGYSLTDLDNDLSPIIITELSTNYTLGKMLYHERTGNNDLFLSDIKKLIIIYGIAAGMSFIHSNNIIHRDLIPYNIYLDDKLYPKIHGFYLAKKISDDNDQIKPELVGTPAYLAPEILISGTYGKKSDIYAFSLIIYEIITNEEPFYNYKDKDPLEFFEDVKYHKVRPNFNKEIPECYKNLIEKCWSQDPQDRPTFDEILEILKNDQEFIIDKKDKEEFYKYIEFINTSKMFFDEKKRAHHLDHFINTRLRFFYQDNNAFFRDIYSTSLEPVNLKSFVFDFSNFEKREKIGEGSFGKVFKIINKKTGEILAVKESFRSLDDSLSKRNNVKSEVGALFNLEFPSITKLVGFSFNNIKNKPKPTFVLEYVSNGSLNDILEMERKGEKIDQWNDTKKLINFYGIASGINYLHSHYIMHRDLKPSNILLDDYLLPKISDFNFAKYKNDLFEENSYESNKSIPSTPEYMDPLILNGDRYNNKCDIYSFAMIMYEVLTGEKPFKDFKNPVDIVNEVTQNNGRPKFNDKVPNCYRCLIEKCWQYDESKRPRAEEILEILKTNPEFITENVNKEEFFDYVEYIDSAVIKRYFDRKINIFTFEKGELKGHSFQKVDIYLNRPKIIEQRNLSINIQYLDISRYEINQSVGEGSFGTVYKVIDKVTSEILAAKVSIYDIDLCNDDMVFNLEREVNIISKLNHPSIIKFIGFNPLNFKYKRKPTIVTEYVSNGSLDKILELERMSIGLADWDDTKKLINIYGIASAIAYLHSLNILHRDLKPANILLDDYLFPKISDFGLSKQILEENAPNNSGFKGTYAYSAPEVFEGKYSKAGDVFSFALIVYEIVTSEVLYPKLNQYQLMSQVRKGLRPSFKFAIPSSYKNLITDCWNEDPKKRPTFNEITSRIKNDPGFITENVDKEEFLNYISLIDDDFGDKNITFKTIKLNSNKKKEEDLKNDNFLDLSKYEKVSLISKGDFYKIYKIKNKETGEIYQGKISIIKLNNFSRDELINLSHEVNIISKINHPSFLKFIGYSPTDFKNQNKPVILTEFSLNDSLHKILELERKGENVKDWDDTKKLINIFGIASAMAYLHSYNIIHRDLRPCNIFLDDYLFPKIGDFGLSKRIHNFDSLTYQTTSGLKGSPTYSSPEILQFNDYSKSGDVYAFAFVVYEIVTHDLPFKDFKNTNEIYSEVVLKGNRPKIPSFVLNCYRQLIEKCWSQDPNERPSFDAIADNLKNNVNFITKNIRKEDYTNYIEFIEKSQLSFDFKHQILKLDDFIKSKSKIDENEQKINEIEQSNDQNNSNDLSDDNKRLIQNGEETNKVDVNQDQLIDEFITLKDAKKLMEYLNNECENEKVSSIFDRCYFDCPEFYSNLCKEGMKLNNAVAHHKYALSLIFNNNYAKSPEDIISKFSEVRSHLEESIRRGYKESHFLLARILHEFFHDNKRAFETADEGRQKGDKYSACLLGFFVAKGIGIIKNHQKGVSMMLESGASDFYDKLSTDIGIYYINLAKSSEYKKENADLYKQKAFEFFEKAYKMNKTKATINNYGICFILGIGVSKNIEKAKEIFQMGVSKGDENSKYHLDFILEKSK